MTRSGIQASLVILAACFVSPAAAQDVVGSSDKVKVKAGSPTVQRLRYDDVAEIIQVAARKTELHPALIRAVIQNASDYQKNKRTRDGRIGLMQVPEIAANRLGLKNPFDPYENILAGSRYLRELFEEFGSIRLAVAAYHADPQLVRDVHQGAQPSQETRRFVERVLRNYDSLRIIYMTPDSAL